VLAAIRPEPHEKHLIEPERVDRAVATGVVVDEGGAVGDDGVVDGVPITAELHGDLVDGARVAPHLFGHPAPCPIGHCHTWRGDAGVLLGPRSAGTRCLTAAPPALVPHKTRRATERRQVDQLDDRALLHRGERSISLIDAGKIIIEVVRETWAGLVRMRPGNHHAR